MSENETRKRKRAELMDWLGGPFVKEMQRYLDAQIKNVNAMPLLQCSVENLERSHQYATGALGSLLTVAAVLDPDTEPFESCFFPEEEEEDADVSGNLVGRNGNI